MKAPRDFGVDDSALTEMVVPSDLRSAREPEQRIMARLARHGYDTDTSFGIKLALEEALTNAIKHGNRNDPDKHIVIRYYVDRARFIVMVRDEGDGFRWKAIPDPTSDENLERPNGRGIMLMQSYMTRIRFNRRGNEVWMLKRQPGCAK